MKKREKSGFGFIAFLLILILLIVRLSRAEELSPSNWDMLSSEDGLISLRLPSGWYQAGTQDGNQTVLVAAESPERAGDWAGGGDLLLRVYIDYATQANAEALLQRTLKDHALDGLTWTDETIRAWGLEGTLYQGEVDALQAAMSIFSFTDVAGLQTWIRIVAVGDRATWDENLTDEWLMSPVILPQTAPVPRGWQAEMRAPQGWEAKTFSSFVQWVAPDDSPLAGSEIWFQAGFRSELIGQGEPAFVMRSLGVNYTTQVDESSAYPIFLGGLPATAQPFESFTHSGVAISVQSETPADGTRFGTANLILRAPLGQWTDAHQRLFESVAASVRILPPTADAAPTGLQMGYRPPNFSAQFAEGGTFNLSDFEDQLVLVHFWFVDCPYCHAEWPGLQAVYDEYKDAGLVLLAINAIDSPQYIAAYLAEMGLDFPLILDNGALHNLYNVRAFPSTFVVGPDGVLVQVARGPLNERSVRNLAERYLSP